MSYFTDEQAERIRKEAHVHSRDNLWSFIHSMLFFACQEKNKDLVAQVYEAEGFRDGTYRGKIFINEFAELIEIAIKERQRIDEKDDR